MSFKNLKNKRSSLCSCELQKQNVENKAPFGFGGCLSVVHLHAGVEERASGSAKPWKTVSQLVMTFKVENNSFELTRIFKESFRDQRWAWEESVRAEKRDRDAEREKETFRRQRHHQSWPCSPDFQAWTVCGHAPDREGPSAPRCMKNSPQAWRPIVKIAEKRAQTTTMLGRDRSTCERDGHKRIVAWSHGRASCSQSERTLMLVLTLAKFLR